MTDNDEVLEVQVGEAGGCKVTALCPLCKAQVIGYTSQRLMEDLIYHLNEFHARNEPVTVAGKVGRA